MNFNIILFRTSLKAYFKNYTVDITLLESENKNLLLLYDHASNTFYIKFILSVL